MSPADAKARRRPTEDDVFRMVRAALGVELHPGGVIPIPAGHFNASFEITPGGRPAVVRVAPPQDDSLLYYERGMMEVEAAMHPIVRRRTGVPVAEILAYDPSGKVFPRPFIIMEKLPGRLLGDGWPRLSSGQRRSFLVLLGRMVREFHSIEGELFGYAWPNGAMAGAERWPDAFAEMAERILADNVRGGAYTPGEAEALGERIRRNLGALDDPPAPVFCHMDLWHQNILVDKTGRITGILDLDRAVWGTPEVEFAVLDTYGLTTPEFFKGYGTERPSGAEVDVRRILYTIVELVKYPFIRLVRNGRPSAAADHKRQVSALAAELP